MGLGPSSAVLETLRRNNPGLTLQVDLGPSGANHFARPETRQQRDFKSSRSDAMSEKFNRAHHRRPLIALISLNVVEPLEGEPQVIACMSVKYRDSKRRLFDANI
jgi:hypothetical protein